jgi:thiosulfate/3-mercaptopyruvate sulfurtransferase
MEDNMPQKTMTETGGFVHPQHLVQTEWLDAHLRDPELRVLDCSVHLIPDPKITYRVVPGRAEFEKAHIPGAQFADLHNDLSDRSQPYRFMLPSAAHFAAAMGRLGVGEDSRVILYSATTLWWATRVWWMLRVFGFDNAAVLDGGLQKWQREGRAIETGAAAPAAPARFVVREQRPLMVGKHEVKSAIGDASVCTINALMPEQHAGTGGVSFGRPGHIAGSVNVPAAHLVDPATNALRSPAELRAKFDAIGALDREVLVYCGGGIAASADALALVMLGHDKVRLYDASMSEWALDPNLPMEAGDGAAAR